MRVCSDKHLRLPLYAFGWHNDHIHSKHEKSNKQDATLNNSEYYNSVLSMMHARYVTTVLTGK